MLYWTHCRWCFVSAATVIFHRSSGWRCRVDVAANNVAFEPWLLLSCRCHGHCCFVDLVAVVYASEPQPTTFCRCRGQQFSIQAAAIVVPLMSCLLLLHSSRGQCYSIDADFIFELQPWLSCRCHVCCYFVDAAANNVACKQRPTMSHRCCGRKFCIQAASIVVW